MTTDTELADLDVAVAKADGSVPLPGPNGFFIGLDRETPYRPTRDGAEAMRLLEKYRLRLSCYPATSTTATWRAEPWVHRGDVDFGYGETPAIAVCRAVVAMKRSSP